MSEKKQHTATAMRLQMAHRYSDGLHHKHDKCHVHYRLHYRSHPVTVRHEYEQEKTIDDSTGYLRQFKLRKIRKRLDKGRFH